MNAPSTGVASLLVVEDEPRQLVALCNTLEDAEYAATGFSSAPQALEQLRRSSFDLILTDLVMPEMDGIELMRAAQHVDPNIACIVMTGHAAVDTAIDAMKAGALDYVIKPFRGSTLLPMLTRALEVRRLRLEVVQLQDRVQQHVTELEVANRELEAFSYSVSHDLRAPLRAISGFSTILTQDYAPTMPAQAAALLRKVTESAYRMGELIEHLLAFSQISRKPLRLQPVDVAALVRDALGDFDADVTARKIEVRVGELPAAVGDPVLLRQVFVNLLANAFKFTRRQPQAVVEVGSLQQERETVYFVRDNGAGFDMRHAERLFGVFQRLHSAEEYEGTGIGMSFVKRIIQRHGGRIWPQAAVNEGATFFFTLHAAGELCSEPTLSAGKPLGK